MLGSWRWASPGRAEASPSRSRRLGTYVESRNSTGHNPLALHMHPGIAPRGARSIYPHRLQERHCRKRVLPSGGRKMKRSKTRESWRPRWTISRGKRPFLLAAALSWTASPFVAPHPGIPPWECAITNSLPSSMHFSAVTRRIWKWTGVCQAPVPRLGQYRVWCCR